MKKKISEKIIKGLVLTLKPDNAQKLLLDKHLNDTRFIYNQYVEEYLKALKEERIPIIRIIRNYVLGMNFLKVLIHGLFNRFFINLNKLIQLIDLKGQKVKKLV